MRKGREGCGGDQSGQRVEWGDDPGQRREVMIQGRGGGGAMSKGRGCVG
jgi:hypothetical protein